MTVPLTYADSLIPVKSPSLVISPKITEDKLRARIKLTWLVSKHVLRLFGEGVKVACEITCMGADAGLIRTDEEAIGIGGSGGGADTAIVLKPSNTHAFFDLRIKEIICKPHL